ncbi:MAG: A/G-specific adenine glycosylase [Acidobacteria bacterium]|nr:A/G-specific adenine glycosylase [Acidobacteriota bacterium]
MSKPAASEAVYLPPAEIRRLQTGLLAWYRQHQRQLPWRESRNFYPVWVSEVMLQQTQVQTVVPYFLRFMKAFPTLEDLAEADTQDLLRIWAGLGYYSRARNLQRAARILLREHGGKFPGSYREALRLPGIGRYTAAAILSIAFDQPLAALDGNVVRVLSRLFSLKGDPAKPPVQGMLAAAGQQLLPDGRPGDFNQALMELGATVCLPRNPRCLLCPWSSHCEALKTGMQDRLPEKAGRSGIRLSRQAAAVIRHRGRFLIRKRSGSRLLRDMWEFPGGEFSRSDLAGSLVKYLESELHLSVRLCDRLTVVKHAVTNRRITLTVYEARLKPPPPATLSIPGARWIWLSQAGRYPLTAAASRIVQALTTEHSHPHGRPESGPGQVGRRVPLKP